MKKMRTERKAKYVEAARRGEEGKPQDNCETRKRKEIEKQRWVRQKTHIRERCVCQSAVSIRKAACQNMC